MLEEALDHGVEVRFESVTALRSEGDGWVVESDGGTMPADVVVVATGGEHGPSPIAGASAYLGQGVSECAGCDGPMFAGATVAVVGDGPWVASDARSLARHAEVVHVIGHRAPAITDGRIIAHPDAKATAIDVHEGRLAGLILDRTDTGEDRLAVQGVFLSMQTRPRTTLVADLVDLDDEQRIRVDDRLCSSIGTLLAIGDVRSGTTGAVAGALADADAAARTILDLALTR